MVWECRPTLRVMLNTRLVLRVEKNVASPNVMMWTQAA